MGFEVFPESCDRGGISYLEGDRNIKASRTRQLMLGSLNFGHQNNDILLR